MSSKDASMKVPVRKDEAPKVAVRKDVAPKVAVREDEAPKVSVRKDVARNRAALMASADALFRQRGTETTLDEIAQHAGVGVATAYRHFASKQALMTELIEDRIQAAEAILHEALALDDPRDAIEAFLYRTAETQAGDRGLREALGSDHAIHKLSDLRERLSPLAQEIFRRAAEAGLLRPEVSHLDVPVIFWILGAVSDHSGGADPQLWRRYLDFIFDGMLAEGVERRQVTVGPMAESEIEGVIRGWTGHRRPQL